MVSNVKRPQLIGFLVLWVLSAWPQSAAAQVSPETQVRIAAYIEQSRALATAYDARPRPDPYAALRAQSARLTAAQRAQAQALFNSAFQVWQTGDLNAAEIGFRQGLEIDPANGAANFYMGDILRRRSAAADAANFMTRAVAFAPNSAEGLRAQAALRELPPVPDPDVSEPPVIFAPPGAPIVFRDCADCPEMVMIPQGAFTMGSPATEANRPNYESPQRRIRFGHAFAVGKFEVTFDQWTACVNRGGCSAYSPADQGWGRGNRPVINVSWENARDYVLWLSRETRQSYRLLSEAEWEYAARAGTDTPYPWGHTASHENGNYGADTCCSGLASGFDQWVNTSPVGSFPANAFGLHDMHGNVWEWVQDCFASSYSGLPTDGSASEIFCANRVNRGGSWSVNPRGLRSAYRAMYTPSYRLNDFGFRVARAVN